MRQGWQETLLRGLLLLLLLLGSRSWNFVASQDSSGFDFTDSRGYFGDRCSSNDDCNFEGLVCAENNGNKRCMCHPDLPITNYFDKCGKDARINENCSFDEQCKFTTKGAECKNGLCVCQFGIEPSMESDGTLKCVSELVREKRNLFGDKCTTDEDCQFHGSVCEEHNGYKRCRCHPDLPVSNHYNSCGRAAEINTACNFTEQCEVTTMNTECKEGICVCRFEKKPIMGSDGRMNCPSGRVRRKRNLFGDKCSSDENCTFHGAVCVERNGHKICQCQPDLPITNHYNSCGTAVRVNESCNFTEQCEALTLETDCREGVCVCRFEKQPKTLPDGKIECIVVQNIRPSEKYVDPAMIGILVAMFLMFITICVVLRLFSRARWRENRTIFNTPNPRLMNVSLLRDNKLLHTDRRGSRSSARGPSRQPSMASLRAHSPNSQGSRRGSRGSSNASATSNRSNKSPPQAPNMSSATTPMLESVTVEVQEPKA